jgi:hypothetical protein
LRLDETIDETTNRAMAMYSGLAGISSSRIISMGQGRARAGPRPS